MKRPLAVLLLAVATLLGTAACGDGDPADVSGDSVTENNQTQVPAPVPS